MSTTSRSASAFSSANPHALATILEASETRRIIAATDIFDLAGTKLWARNQPVSAELQRKLLDRKLREPLEACLVAEDGVTSASLGAALAELIERDGRLAPLLRPQASRLLREVTHLHLHPVAQLLLSAAQAARTETFEHAVAAMALSGALMAQQGGQTVVQRMGDGRHPAQPQSVRLAISAPSAMLASFAKQIGGWIAPKPAKVPKPQSVAAITRSRPTMSA